MSKHYKQIPRYRATDDKWDLLQKPYFLNKQRTSTSAKGKNNQMPIQKMSKQCTTVKDIEVPFKPKLYAPSHFCGENVINLKYKL